MDGFRAVAIAGIVLLHLIGLWEALAVGSAGSFYIGLLPPMVEVLFILSGFVVFLPTVARGGDFGSPFSYAVRRAARLVPAYWLALAVTLLLIPLWPVAPAPEFPPLQSLLAHLGIVHVPARIFDTGIVYGFGLAGPVWTLSLEVMFYVLLPFVAGAYFRHPFIGLAAAVAITVGWKLGFANAGSVASALGLSTDPESLRVAQRTADNQFPSFALHFGLGMTAAWLFVELPKRFDAAVIRRWAVRVQLTTALLFLGGAYLFGEAAALPGGDFPFIARREIGLVLAIGFSLAAFMLATALAPDRWQRPFAWPALRRLGDISYGMYLIHAPLMIFVATLILREQFLPFGLFGTLAVTTIPLTIAYGYLSARVLEQPVRRWAQRFGRRGEGAAQRGGFSGGPTPVER